MFGLSENIIKMLKEEYPAGTRIKCLSMSDPYRDLSGECGTVRLVDDAGTIHVNWDCGSGLGLVYGEDHFMKL